VEARAPHAAGMQTLDSRAQGNSSVLAQAMVRQTSIISISYQ
jgi:hypothetical protein